MAGNKQVNSDLEILGKAIVSTVPNNTGAVLTYNAASKEISQRTNAQIIDDLGLITATNIAAAYYTKTQLQTSGQAQVHWNNLTNVPTTFTPTAHNHDDRYYTETESDNKYVPYTGATQNVNLGDKNLEFAAGSISRVQGASRIFNKVYQSHIAGASTGILSIKFPQATTSVTMFDVTIKCYGYNSKYLGEVRIAFYKSSGTAIHTAGAKAVISGSSNFPVNSVQVGINTDGKVCINLGTTSTPWSTFMSFEVERVEVKHTGYNFDWSQGWEHSIETTTPELVANGGTYQSIVNNATFATEFNSGHINKAFLDVINQDLGTTHSPTFNGINIGYVSSTFKGFSSTTPFSFHNGATAQRIYTGGVLASDSYANANLIPVNGAYIKGQIRSGVPTGTAPLVVSSTTVVPNLNADLLDGQHGSYYEPAFTKNTAFNKNFGTTAGTVAQGNDSRIINGQTAFGWGDFRNYGLGQGQATVGTWDLSQDYSGFVSNSNHGIPGWSSGRVWGFRTSFNDTNYGVSLAMRNSRAAFQTRENGTNSGWLEFWHSGNFNPANYASSTHTHTIAQITGLQTALDGKVNKAGDTMTGALSVKPGTAQATHEFKIDNSGGRNDLYVRSDNAATQFRASVEDNGNYTLSIGAIGMSNVTGFDFFQLPATNSQFRMGFFANDHPSYMSAISGSGYFGGEVYSVGYSKSSSGFVHQGIGGNSPNQILKSNGGMTGISLWDVIEEDGSLIVKPFIDYLIYFNGGDIRNAVVYLINKENDDFYIDELRKGQRLHLINQNMSAVSVIIDSQSTLFSIPSNYKATLIKSESNEYFLYDVTPYQMYTP